MQRFIVCLCVCLLIVLSGCLISGDTTEKRTGNYVAESIFSKIEPGKTTAGWVQATLGDPTSKSSTGDSEVWKYTYTQKTDNSGAVFLIFGGHNSSETTGTAFVEIKDGIVTSKWRG